MTRQLGFGVVLKASLRGAERRGNPLINRLNNLKRTPFLTTSHKRYSIVCSAESLGEGIKRKGFTLAETLITLGIIGVVAALTIPSLVQKYQEKVWTTSFLRVYSILENAYKMAQNEYGTVENWPDSSIKYTENGEKVSILGDANITYEYMIKPYIKVNKVFMTNSNEDRSCMPYVKANGKIDLFQLDGKLWEHHYWKAPIVSLPSGECISMDRQFAQFIVDLNSKKGPNTLGKDIFLFSFDVKDQYRLKPGYPEIGWTDTANYCDRTDAHGWLAGMSCGFWIVRHHNMDYLHLPFEEVKKQWSGGVW